VNRNPVLGGRRREKREGQISGTRHPCFGESRLERFVGKRGGGLVFGWGGQWMGDWEKVSYFPYPRPRKLFAGGGVKWGGGPLEREGES